VAKGSNETLNVGFRRLSLAVAVNPIERLSGDQNGKSAPSVPASGCASVLSSARKQRRFGPSPEATKTMYRPAK